MCITEPPAAPRKLTVDEVTKSSCVLSWKAPEFDGGSPVTGYYVEYQQPAYSTRWLKVNKTPTKQTTYTVKDLVEFAEYDFRVLAENAAGISQPCKIADLVIAKEPYDKPSAPGRPRVTELTKETAALSWTAPEDDGNSPITNYVVEMRPARSFHWTTVSDKVSGLSYTVRGLKPGAEYEFRVTAENKAGQSAPSELLSSVKYGKDKLETFLTSCYVTLRTYLGHNEMFIRLVIMLL